MSILPGSPGNAFKRDSNFWWRPGRVYYPASEFTGMIGAAGVDAGVHTGAPVQQEIGTIGIVGILMDTAGDMVTHNAAIPSDFDVNHPAYVRVHWCSGSTDVADTVTWLLTYTALIPNVTALITPATALNKVIAAQDVPVATANVLCATAWGRINGKAISHKAEAWAWLLEMDAFDVGLSEDKFLLGFEVAYTPKRLHYGDGMRREAEAPRYMLGDDYSVV